MICGIFLGGASSRMGKTKALLLVDGETLLARTCRVVREAGLEAMLVGPRPEIVAQLPARLEGLVRIADVDAERGPLGGLVALLRYARTGHVMALACDMPFVRPTTLAKLWAARESAPIVAPKRGEKWEPLVAVYEVAPVLAIAETRLANDKLGLQGLLRRCDARVFDVKERELTDWDTLEDVERDTIVPDETLGKPKDPR